MDNQEQKLKRIYSKTKVDTFYNKLVKGKGNFLIRFGSECNELIFDNAHNVFATENKNFDRKLLCLFNMVQTDVRNFLNINPYIDIPPKVNTTEYNYFYNDEIGTLTATDLDHAFWRIAYVKGYITKKTYEKGLPTSGKAIRLASLSVLGRGKKFDKYVNGEYQKTIVVKEKDAILQKVYVDIRYSCYYMMYELSQILKDDFESWKTDCIYYRDTPENRKIVHNYFEEREMLFKQLI
jgi:hypothetical protein